MWFESLFDATTCLLIIAKANDGRRIYRPVTAGEDIVAIIKDIESEHGLCVFRSFAPRNDDVVASIVPRIRMMDTIEYATNGKVTSWNPADRFRPKELRYPDNCPFGNQDDRKM